jgi:hypothetical protein
VTKQDNETLWLNEFAKQTESVLADDKAARAALRDTAKWLIGGVALTAGGLVAGSTLSSLGSLDLGGRLLIALCAVSVGIVALIFLLASAIKVLEPRTYDWRSLLLPETALESDLVGIVSRVQAALIPKGGPSLEALARVHLDLVNQVTSSSNPVDPESRKELIATGNLLQRATSHISFEHSRFMFTTLKNRLYVVLPVIAVSLGLFSWAATPSRENPSDISPVVKQVDVVPDDVKAIQKTMTSPECYEARITVVTLREWRSGAQDVVTIPKGGQCSPVALRLDHGRLSPIH